MSAKTVSCVFKTWIRFLYVTFEDEEFKERMKVKRVDIPTLPKAFRNDVLKDCRYVIDCTEIEVGNLKLNWMYKFFWVL